MDYKKCHNYVEAVESAPITKRPQEVPQLYREVSPLRGNMKFRNHRETPGSVTVIERTKEVSQS